jgi:hypothetical protein
MDYFSALIDPRRRGLGLMTVHLLDCRHDGFATDSKTPAIPIENLDTSTKW